MTRQELYFKRGIKQFCNFLEMDCDFTTWLDDFCTYIEANETILVIITNGEAVYKFVNDVTSRERVAKAEAAMVITVQHNKFTSFKVLSKLDRYRFVHKDIIYEGGKFYL